MFHSPRSMITLTICKEFLSKLFSGVENADDLLCDQVLIKELKVRLMERMLGVELTRHFGFKPGDDPAPEQSDHFDGSSHKNVKGTDGALPIGVPSTAMIVLSLSR